MHPSRHSLRYPWCPCSNPITAASILATGASVGATTLINIALASSKGLRVRPACLGRLGARRCLPHALSCSAAMPPPARHAATRCLDPRADSWRQDDAKMNKIRQVGHVDPLTGGSSAIPPELKMGSAAGKGVGWGWHLDAQRSGSTA